MFPEESHVTPFPTSTPAESNILEYWYVPDELNLDTNEAVLELAGSVDTNGATDAVSALPAWSFMVGVPL